MELYSNDSLQSNLSIALSRKQWIKLCVLLESNIKNTEESIEYWRIAASKAYSRGDPSFCNSEENESFYKEQLDTIKAFLAAYEAASKHDAAILE